jgi:hypothetical protein
VRDALPAVPFTLADLKEAELAEGLKAFTRGKFIESLAAFRTVLQKAMLIAVPTDAEAIEVSLAIVKERPTTNGSHSRFRTSLHWPRNTLLVCGSRLNGSDWLQRNLKTLSEIWNLQPTSRTVTCNRLIFSWRCGRLCESLQRQAITPPLQSSHEG